MSAAERSNKIESHNNGICSVFIFALLWMLFFVEMTCDFGVHLDEVGVKLIEFL